MIRTRFAPSPSGYLHIGNIRTALWNYLYAVRHAGEFVVRIENSDQARSQSEYTSAITRDLKQLGISYSDCIEQQNRTDVYNEAMHKLQTTENLYPCFCSQERLDAVRKQQAKQGKPPRYDGQCRSLSQDERKQHIAAGVSHVWRFAVPHSGEVSLPDPVRNKTIAFACANIEDFVIQRTDGSYVFLFTNVVDDIASHITHVMRGEDHLSNTPKQILLCHALAAPVPVYIHCPLIVAKNKKPLSKRDGAFDVRSLLVAGYRVDAVCNYLARIGCDYQDTTVHTMTELATRFDIGHISLSAATFAPEQLDDWQKRALDCLSVADWCEWAACAVDDDTFSALGDIARLESWARDNCVHYADVNQWAHALVHGSISSDTTRDMLQEFTSAEVVLRAAHSQTATPVWKKMTKSVQATTGYGGKALFMPLRIALSGHASGPPLDGLWNQLSVAERTKRLAVWLDALDTTVTAPT